MGYKIEIMNIERIGWMEIDFKNENEISMDDNEWRWREKIK